MKLPFYFAKRYLFGKKSKNVINYISAISVIVIAIVTMALFVVLSVFNGLEGLIVGMYDSFDPDLKITPSTGKTFVPSSLHCDIHKIPGVISYAEVIEEDVLMKYADKQFIGRIKGVSSNFTDITPITNQLTNGEYLINDTVIDYVIVGQGLAYFLSVGLHNADPIHIYAPSRNAKKITAPEKSYKHSYAYPSAVFQTQQEIDNKYFISSIGFARKLLDYTTEVSALEIKVAPGQVDNVKNTLEKALGSNFNVKDRYEQHEFMYKVLKSEKWGIFLIISFILLVASFNIVGSLTMLIIDKKKDIGILKSMGAENSLIKRIFLYEGWMISILGAFFGLALGLIICWLQINFGLLKLSQEGNFIIDSYPVVIQPLDILWVFLVVIVIGFIAAYIPTRSNIFKK